MLIKNQIKKYERLDLDKLKNPYFQVEIAKKAEEIDSTAGGYVITLCKLGVCGCGSTEMLCDVTRLLDKLGVEYSVNRRGIIWMNSISENLKKSFSGK